MGKMTLADWRDEFQHWLAAVPVRGTPESQAAVRAWIDGVIQAARDEERAACLLAVERAEAGKSECACGALWQTADSLRQAALDAIRRRAD